MGQTLWDWKSTQQWYSVHKQRNCDRHLQHYKNQTLCRITFALFNANVMEENAIRSSLTNQQTKGYPKNVRIAPDLSYCDSGQNTQCTITQWWQFKDCNELATQSYLSTTQIQWCTKSTSSLKDQRSKFPYNSKVNQDRPDNIAMMWQLHS